NPLGEAARAPRHRVDAQLSATHHGWGLRAGGVWTSGGRDGVGNTGTLDFADRFAFNFRLFWFPERNPAIARAAPYMHGVRFLLAVDNLFDSWQRVRDAGGATPLAYQRWILDPMGRTVRLSIRKTLD
ncbi:MAG TPA: TonB-dependent receptor, partial [Novosphingobium sp.]|nr:TonB-dependent receptor [Novosphingobium sp.]